MAMYFFRKPSTLTHDQIILMIIKYAEVRNTTLFWKARLDMDEGWMLFEETVYL